MFGGEANGGKVTATPPGTWLLCRGQGPCGMMGAEAEVSTALPAACLLSPTTPQPAGCSASAPTPAGSRRTKAQWCRTNQQLQCVRCGRVPHGQQGLRSWATEASSRRPLLGTGGQANLARLKGNARARGCWAAEAGRLGRRGRSTNRHLKLRLRTPITPRTRSREPGKMAGRKPNSGAFSASLPAQTYRQGWEASQASSSFVPW